MKEQLEVRSEWFSGTFFKINVLGVSATRGSKYIYMYISFIYSNFTGDETDS